MPSNIQVALDKVHEEYGLYNQLEVVHADETGAIFAPLEDSLYSQTDIDFLECKFKEYLDDSNV